jgi:hypothetical protein
MKCLAIAFPSSTRQICTIRTVRLLSLSYTFISNVQLDCHHIIKLKLIRGDCNDIQYLYFTTIKFVSISCFHQLSISGHNCSHLSPHFSPHFSPHLSVSFGLNANITNIYINNCLTLSFVFLSPGVTLIL